MIDACDIRFQDNVAFYMGRGYDHETALRLAFEEEERVIDALEREEEA